MAQSGRPTASYGRPYATPLGDKLRRRRRRQPSLGISMSTARSNEHTDTSRAARLGVLAGLGLVIVLLYAFGITARYPLAVGLQRPRISWYTLSGHSLRAGLVFALVIGLLILC